MQHRKELINNFISYKVQDPEKNLVQLISEKSWAPGPYFRKEEGYSSVVPVF